MMSILCKYRVYSSWDFLRLHMGLPGNMDCSIAFCIRARDLALPEQGLDRRDSDLDRQPSFCSYLWDWLLGEDLALRGEDWDRLDYRSQVCCSC